MIVNSMMASNTGLETNLVLGLSHLQRNAASRSGEPGTCKAVRSLPKTKKTLEAEVDNDEPSASTQPRHQSPSRRRLWNWKHYLSPTQRPKLHKRKSSGVSAKSSPNDRLACALPLDFDPPSLFQSSSAPSNLRSKWPWRRGRNQSTSQSPKQALKKTTATETSLRDFSEIQFDDISDISQSEPDYQGTDEPLVVEADVRDPVALQEENYAFSTAWSIQVMDDDIEVVKSTSSASMGTTVILWFRIYFHREDDYVYYRGNEILDYVRDLVELDGSFTFAVTIMSTGVSTMVGASEILNVLGEIVESETAPRHELPGLVLNTSDSTGEEMANVLSIVE